MVVAITEADSDGLVLAFDVVPDCAVEPAPAAETDADVITGITTDTSAVDTP